MNTARAKELNVGEEQAKKVCSLFAERISVANELNKEFEAGDWDYLFKEPVFDSELLIWKKDDKDATISNFDAIIKTIEEANFSDTEILKNSLAESASKIGNGSFFWPLRVALSGKEKSPDPISLMLYFGKEQTLVRLNNAKNALQK